MSAVNLNRVMFALAAVGLVIAGLLWYWHAQNADIPCTNAGCDRVAQHPTSRLFGIPVAAYGTLFYLTFALLCAIRPSVPADQQRFMASLLLLWGIVGFLVSVYLIYLELFVIRAICQWCVASAIIATALFVLSVLAWRQPQALTIPSEA
ncbi:MAG: vitamin K epoxide reductase family protein [Armatimonadota bacterium]|nr:vitamin K epoxide reductase family protein [bacterium]MDW8321924.1 vitamin K epoxide reductase family protein [Armatimonadota bacterium]